MAGPAKKKYKKDVGSGSFVGRQEAELGDEYYEKLANFMLVNVPFSTFEPKDVKILRTGTHGSPSLPKYEFILMHSQRDNTDAVIYTPFAKIKAIPSATSGAEDVLQCFDFKYVDLDHQNRKHKRYFGINRSSFWQIPRGPSEKKSTLVSIIGENNFIVQSENVNFAIKSEGLANIANMANTDATDTKKLSLIRKRDTSINRVYFSALTFIEEFCREELSSLKAPPPGTVNPSTFFLTQSPVVSSSVPAPSNSLPSLSLTPSGGEKQ